MPPKNKTKKIEKDLKEKVDAGIDAIRTYIDFYANQSNAKLKERILPSIESETDNEEETPVYFQDENWNRVALSASSFFSSSISYVGSVAQECTAANLRKLGKNQKLKKDRRKLASDCLEAIEQAESNDDKLNLIEKLLLDNMGLSIKRIGESQVHSGELSDYLREALGLSKEDAHKMNLERQETEEAEETKSNLKCG